MCLIEHSDIISQLSLFVNSFFEKNKKFLRVFFLFQISIGFWGLFCAIFPLPVKEACQRGLAKGRGRGASQMDISKELICPDTGVSDHTVAVNEAERFSFESISPLGGGDC